MTGLTEAMAEKSKTMVNTIMVLNETKWLLKVIAFNANDIWRQCYELSKHLQDLYI
jgi:hypothetical protein